MDTFNPGDVILGKYAIIRVLGKGGMGTVVAARRIDVDLTVALKFLHPSLGETPGVTGRFIKEARAGMRIKSRHVAQVFDVVTEGDASFIVMEYLGGKDFAEVLREGGPLPILKLADWLLQASEAIAEAHALSIVHRDLKPQNLFLTTGPDGLDLVKVLDFGIAKSIDPGDDALTATTGMMGSPRYMSPEQVAGAKDIDARTDVWSLGVILYELLTGKPPFAGDTPGTVSASILSGMYVPLREACPDTSPELEALVSHALTRERDDRLASVEAFAARLAPFGSDAARSSYAHIKRVASHAPPPKEAAVLPSVVPVGGGAPTAAGQDSLSVSDPPPAGIDTTSGKAAPRASASRWRAKVALGMAGGGAVALAFALSGVGRGSQTAASTAAPIDASPMLSAAPADAAAPVVAASSASAAPSATPAASIALEVTATTGSSSPEVPQATGCAKGATSACEAACALKTPGSCLALARALEKGTGAPKNPERAARLYEQACNGGEMAACNALGLLYARGVGVAHDPAKAIDLYTRACDRSLALACLNLGSMHFTGDGVPKNESLGARFFLQACDAHEPLGCVNVSVAYAKGAGVPRDAERAYAYAEQGCTGGAPLGCVRVGMAKIEGQGVTKDVKGGLAQVDALCTRRSEDACEALAGLYARGSGADVPVDPLRVRTYAKKACDLGGVRACEAARLLPMVDHSDSTAGRATAMIQAKCDGGVCARGDGGAR